MKKNKEALSFSSDELMKELEKYRSRTYICGWQQLNKDQINFIKLARENKNPVSYVNMARLWSKYGWGTVTGGTLSNYYKALKERGFKL